MPTSLIPKALTSIALGTATPREAKQEVILDDAGKGLDVVTMKLDLEKPLNLSLYEYFVEA